MNRLQVAAEISGRLVTQLGDAGMLPEDSAGNLKEPIDDALRAMGYAEDALADAESTNVRGFIAMVRYHALRAVLERIGDRFDYSDPDGSLKLNQTIGNVEGLMERARLDVIGIFGSLHPADRQSGFLTINTNTLGYPRSGW